MRHVHAAIAIGAVAAAILAFPGSSLYAQPNVAWDQVTVAYAAARAKGGSDAVDTALDLANGFVSEHPQDGRALTYQGSLSAMRARESVLPWKKLSMLHDGIGLMDDGVALVLKDKALAGGSTEIEVRMVRGTTSARIPRAFGRGGVARADFRAVIDNPNFTQISPRDQGAALAWMAVLTKREGDATGAATFLERARTADAPAATTIWETFQ